jgi:hypothetical protein
VRIHKPSLTPTHAKKTLAHVQLEKSLGATPKPDGFDATHQGTDRPPGGKPGVVNGQPLPLAEDLNVDGSSKHALRTFSGPLVANVGDPEPGNQGPLGNCYLIAALDAVAALKPALVRDLVRASKVPGKFEVRIHDGGRTHVELVDAELYVKQGGTPLYASGARVHKRMELWVPLFEKGYAQHFGGYNGIGRGGDSYTALTQITGVPYARFMTSTNCIENAGAESNNLVAGKADAAWALLQRGLASHTPLCAETFPHKPLTNTGLFTDHAYTILDVSDDDGERTVKLRNPWGSGEPKNNGKDDGVFWLPLEKFLQHFNNIAAPIALGEGA